jgi:hypothetical protein
VQGETTIYVDCLRHGKIFKTFGYGYPASAAGPSAPPDKETLELQAKNDLSNLGLAWPPYEGIEFPVRVSR